MAAKSGGADAFAALGGLHERRNRLLTDFASVGVTGHGFEGVEVVPGDDVGDLLAVTREGGAQMRGHGEMARLAVTPGQGVVGDLAQHVLGKPVAAPLGRQRVGRDAKHLAAQQLGQARPGRRLVQAGHRDQRLGGEGGPQHRGVGGQPPHVRVEGIEPGGQQRVQAVRNGRFANVADEPVHPLDGLHDVPVDQGADGFHGEQRDALCLGGDRRTGGRRHAGHQRVHQRVHQRRIQRVQGQHGAVVASAEPGGPDPARAGRTPAGRPAGPAPSR